MMNTWKATPLPNRDDNDLFVAIVTSQDDRQLIAQCTALDFAKEIADIHNRFDIELASLSAAVDERDAAISAIVKYSHAEQAAYEDAALIAERKGCKYVAEEIRCKAADKCAENKYTN